MPPQPPPRRNTKEAQEAQEEVQAAQEEAAAGATEGGESPAGIGRVKRRAYSREERFLWPLALVALLWPLALVAPFALAWYCLGVEGGGRRGSMIPQPRQALHVRPARGDGAGPDDPLPREGPLDRHLPHLASLTPQRALAAIQIPRRPKCKSSQVMHSSPLSQGL